MDGLLWPNKGDVCQMDGSKAFAFYLIPPVPIRCQKAMLSWSGGSVDSWINSDQSARGWPRLVSQTSAPGVFAPGAGYPSQAGPEVELAGPGGASILSALSRENKETTTFLGSLDFEPNPSLHMCWKRHPLLQSKLFRPVFPPWKHWAPCTFQGEAPHPQVFSGGSAAGCVCGVVFPRRNPSGCASLGPHLHAAGETLHKQCPNLCS